MSDHKKAWDPETMGFGKHEYRHLDPETVNVEDFAKDMRGEQQHFGDVREYNTGANSKHPENDVGLDWLGRPGTIFETDAPGYEGTWRVEMMPVVKSPVTYCRAIRIERSDHADGFTDPEEAKLETISCIDLGCAVDETNHYKQVRTKLLRKAEVNKHSRAKLTKQT